MIELPYPPRVLSPNARPSWAKKHRAIKSYRETVHWLAKIEKMAGRLVLPETELVGLRIEVFPKPGSPPDDDNVIGSFKAGRDALADAFGIDDRRFRYMPVEFSPAVEGGKLIVTLHPL